MQAPHVSWEVVGAWECVDEGWMSQNRSGTQPEHGQRVNKCHSILTSQSGVSINGIQGVHFRIDGCQHFLGATTHSKMKLHDRPRPANARPQRFTAKVSVSWTFWTESKSKQINYVKMTRDVNGQIT